MIRYLCRRSGIEKRRTLSLDSASEHLEFIMMIANVNGGSEPGR